MWAHFVNMGLGAWLITSPVTFGYESRAMTWSDMVSGALIVGLSGVAVRKGWARWAIAVIGMWLLFAPLLFWAPTAAGYANGSLLGCLAITFSVLVPGSPGFTSNLTETPPGWSYNPSEWTQRLPVVALAVIGFFVARYLAAFQLGHIQTVWDPFFGDGTRRILTSDLSHAFPVSDAGLGALAYLFDALAGVAGDSRRWRTMPFMVILFGIAVVPAGVVSIVLVVLQPVAVGAWCSLCLASAIISVVMIPPAIDEFVASAQYLVESRKEGKPFWDTFWKGDQSVTKGVRPHDFRPAEMIPQSLSSLLPPWSLVAMMAAGVFLMFAPALFAMQGLPAHIDQICGALIVVFAVIAVAEVSRAARFFNSLFALGVMVGSLAFADLGVGGRAVHIVVAIATALLTFPRGKIEERYGRWGRFVF